LKNFPDAVLKMGLTEPAIERHQLIARNPSFTQAMETAVPFPGAALPPRNRCRPIHIGSGKGTPVVSVRSSLRWRLHRPDTRIEDVNRARSLGVFAISRRST
jgi:hypothetical protein